MSDQHAATASPKNIPVSATQDAAQSVERNRTPASSLLPVLAMLAAVVLWGGAFPAMKIAVRELGTWPLMWARMSIALALLIPFARHLVPQRISRHHIPLLAGMALFEPCAYFLCETKALQLTTSAQAGVISASMPLMMAVGGWLFLKERVTRHLWGGLALSSLGVAWLTLAGGAATEDAPNPLIGNLLEVGAMFCASGTAICISKLAASGSCRWNPITLTAIQTLCGFLFFLPGAPEVLSGFDEWSSDTVLALIYLGAGSSLGAFGLYNWSLSRMPASRVGTFINLVPVSAVFFGWLCIGETLNTAQYLATGLIMLGVVVGSRARG